MRKRGDVLEITFAAFDENFARAVTLNDNLVLHTNTHYSVAWGLTIYSYKQLLDVNETYFDGLSELPEEPLRALTALLDRPPVSHFLALLSSNSLHARVKAPRLLDLLS